MEDHRTIFQQHYAYAVVSNLHGALVDACMRADRTTAPQVENSHGRSCGAGDRSPPYLAWYARARVVGRGISESSVGVDAAQ